MNQNPYGLTLLELGTKVFVPMRELRYDGRGGLVVEATVLDIWEVWSSPSKKSFYINRGNQSNGERCVAAYPDGYWYKNDRGEDDWSRPRTPIIYKTDDSELKKLLDNSQIMSQFVNTDEPIGHSLSLDDEVFVDLQQALEHVGRSRPRHLLRRLKAIRRNRLQFIFSTQSIVGKYGKKPHRNHPILIQSLKTLPKNPRIWTRW